MTFQPGAVLYTQSFGSRAESVEVPHIDTRAPTENDINYPIGKEWINSSEDDVYQLTSFTTFNGVTTANWQTASGSSGASTFDADTGSATVDGGVIVIAGGTNMNTSAADDTVTVNLDATLTGLTAVTADTFNTGDAETSLEISGATVAASGTNVSVNISLTPKGTGNLVVSSGNLVLSGLATQLIMNGGNVTDFIGQATLVAGTVTVANTNIAAGDRIFVERNDPSTSTALGVFRTAISAGASFTITSLNPTDASTQTNDVSVVDYFIVRQS